MELVKLTKHCHKSCSVCQEIIPILGNQIVYFLPAATAFPKKRIACSKDVGGYARGSLGTSRVTQATEFATEKPTKSVPQRGRVS
jgi:hypothetical protein